MTVPNFVIARRFLPKQSPGVTAEIASSQKALLAMTGYDRGIASSQKALLAMTSWGRELFQRRSGCSQGLL